MASVGQNGSLGFLESTNPFKLAQEPRNPSPPFNLTREGPLEVIKRPVDGGGSGGGGGGGGGGGEFYREVEATIKWGEPKRTDLPIDKYKISWRLGLGGGGGGGGAKATYGEEMRKTIPGNRREFRLTQLLPDSIYHVQVGTRVFSLRVRFLWLC